MLKNLEAIGNINLTQSQRKQFLESTLKSCGNLNSRQVNPASYISPWLERMKMFRGLKTSLKKSSSHAHHHHNCSKKRISTMGEDPNVCQNEELLLRKKPELNRLICDGFETDESMKDYDFLALNGLDKEEKEHAVTNHHGHDHHDHHEFKEEPKTMHQESCLDHYRAIGKKVGTDRTYVVRGLREIDEADMQI